MRLYHIAPAVFHELGEPRWWQPVPRLTASTSTMAAVQQPPKHCRRQSCSTMPISVWRWTEMVDSPDAMWMVGRLYDGDQLIYVIARARQATG